jgi:hypothetical protein
MTQSGDNADFARFARMREEARRRCIPPDAEKEVYHWVRRWVGAPAIPLCWHPDWHKNVGKGWGNFSQPEREREWEYLGPCPSPDDPQPPRWRHVERGTVYTEVGRAEMLSVATWGGDRLVIFRSESGVLMARLEREFDDGRFVRVE